MTIEHIFVQRDNPIRLQLLNDGVAWTVLQMREITKAEIKFLDVYYNSADHSTAFNWKMFEDDAIVEIYLGSIITSGGRDRKAELIVYTAQFPKGIVQGIIDLVVQDTALPTAGGI